VTEPIPVRVTRYRCPHCHRTHSNKRSASQHIDRCWHNPDARGCKTCAHYTPAHWERLDHPNPGVFACVDQPEGCNLGISLAGLPACQHCGGYGECPECGGAGREVKPGPLVHCNQWEASHAD